MATNINKSIKLSSFGGNFNGIVGKLTGKTTVTAPAAAALVNPISASDIELPTSGGTAIGVGVSGNGGGVSGIGVGGVAGISGSGTCSGSGNAFGSLAIPIMRNKDNAKQLPTYFAALQRSANEYLAAEDLDNIQVELETLLSNVAQRARILKSEYESIDKDEKRNDRRLKEKQPGSPATGVINGTTTNGKRKREEPAGVRKKHSSMTILKQQTKQSKNSPMATHTDDSMDYMTASAGGALTGGGGHGNHMHNNQREHQMPKLSVPKNDMPNKFWLSVEPYCMPLSNEDLRLIDELLEQYKGPLVPAIPSLGPHYAGTWANEDMKDLQMTATNSTSNRLKPHNTDTKSATMLKKADGMLEETVTGPLTQRLVSALIEEQMVAHPSEQAAVGEHSNSSSENTYTSATPFSNYRSLSMLKNCIGIENRVKKELIEQGILDLSDFPHHDEDEVLYEIKRVLSEISSVARYNSAELKQLRASTVNEIKRNELKRKLDTIDQEIVEWYKRMRQYRAKRRGFTLEEQQEIYRLTSEQRLIAEQLERTQVQQQTNM